MAGQVLRALEPAALELSLRAVADAERERGRLARHWEQRLERARHDAERAARQYHAAEPEHRLVARERERRWEQALLVRRQVEDEYDRFRHGRPDELTCSDVKTVESLAGDIPALWRAETTTVQDRQEVVRHLVERGWWSRCKGRRSGWTWRSTGPAGS